VRTGASFTGSIVTLALAVAVLNAVAPPLRAESVIWIFVSQNELFPDAASAPSMNQRMRVFEAMLEVMSKLLLPTNVFVDASKVPPANGV
jgi:hypothetical protein